MTRQLFTNVMIFDGNQAALHPGEVLIEDGKISQLARGTRQLERGAGTVVIDGRGATLMPGLVEGHAHVTYPFSVDRAPQGVSLMDVFTGRIPVENHTLISAHNASVLLNSGFTSAYSAGGATMSMEIALRAEIEGGWMPGPRFRASGNEGLPAAAQMDGTLHRATTEADIRQFVKGSAEVGVDVVKFLLSGPAPAGPGDNSAMYTDDLLKAAGDQARNSGVWLSGHARPAEAIKQGLKFGFRVLYHCDGLDEAALDLMEERKKEVFIGPSIGGPVVNREAVRLSKQKGGSSDPNFFLPNWDVEREVEKQAWNCRAMLDRGVRLVAGGDYGFPNLPHGQNARDLGYFVRYMGMSPLEALQTATKWGGELMDLPVGLVKEGYHADLLLVDGDPLQNIELLAQPEKLLMIMKGGGIVKAKEGLHGPRSAPKPNLANDSPVK